MTSRSPHVLLLLGLLTTSGCYFFYPEIPKTPRPQVVDGEKVALSAQDHDFATDCEPGSHGCGLTSRAEWKRTGTYTTTRATYNGKELTGLELRRLVDPEFEQKLERIRGRKGTCSVSLVPSVISAIGIAVLTVAGAAADNLGDKALPVALAGLGATGGGALLSYPLGGFACRTAAREYRELFQGMSGTERKEFSFDDDVLLETVELTRAFNRRFGKRVPPGEDDRSADATPRASESSD